MSLTLSLSFTSLYQSLYVSVSLSLSLFLLLFSSLFSVSSLLRLLNVNDIFYTCKKYYFYSFMKVL